MRWIPTGAAGGLGGRRRTETNHLLSARSRPPRNPAALAHRPAAAADNARCPRTGTWCASRVQDLFTSGGGAAATQRRPRPAASRSPAPRPRDAFPIGCRRGFSGGGRRAEPHVPPRPISAGHARGLLPSLLTLPRWAGRGLRTYDAAVRAPRAARREGHVPVGAVRIWRARLGRAVRGAAPWGRAVHRAVGLLLRRAWTAARQGTRFLRRRWLCLPRLWPVSLVRRTGLGPPALQLPCRLPTNPQLLLLPKASAPRLTGGLSMEVHPCNKSSHREVIAHRISSCISRKVAFCMVNRKGSGASAACFSCVT